jgi:hypothetical protein
MANRPGVLNLVSYHSCRWCGATPRILAQHIRDCPKRPKKRATRDESQAMPGNDGGGS